MLKFVQSYSNYLVIVVHSLFKLFNQIINLFIRLIYFYIDAEKPFLGMLNKVHVCMYVCDIISF